jgi:fructose-1,6-bisphosphatase I
MSVHDRAGGDPPKTTLTEHLDGGLRPVGSDGPELSRLLEALAVAAQGLAREVRRAALTGNTGMTGNRNVTGDVQKKLDVIGNEIVLEAIVPTGLVAAVVSEELPDARILARDGRYVLCTDPLDGSSNTDINGTVGTIFGVCRRATSGPVGPADLLRPGAEQVLAGYVMYGPATLLVYTAGRGTHGFTFDAERGAFVSTHPDLRCPPRGPYYSANLARSAEWAPGTRRFVESLTAAPAASAAGGRSWSLRYTGALVADLHRSLVEGGVYFYPADAKNKSGKLRLLYECAPLAFVTEQAGGAASTGARRMLDVRPDSIHQRSPLVIGSAEDVALYERFADERSAP